MKIRMRILDSYHSIRLITYSQSFQQTCSRFEKANVKVAFCFNSYTYYYPRSILKKYNHFKIAFASFLRHKQKYREPKLRRIIQNVVLLTLNSDKSFESFEKEILERNIFGLVENKELVKYFCDNYANMKNLTNLQMTNLEQSIFSKLSFKDCSN